MVVLEGASKIMDFQPPLAVGRAANHQIRLSRAPSTMLFPEWMKRKILKISEVCWFLTVVWRNVRTDNIWKHQSIL